MYELAFENYMLIVSGLVAILLLPLSGINLVIQLLPKNDRDDFLREYYSWKFGYDIQIVAIMMMSILYLHVVVALAVVINVVIWYVGLFLKRGEYNHV